MTDNEVVMLVEEFLRKHGWTLCADQTCAYWHDKRTGRELSREDARRLQMDRHITAAEARAPYEAAIRAHRDQRGHDRCHLDDEVLYAVLPEGPQPPRGLPPREEFLAGCERFERLRRHPGAPIDSTASDGLTLLANAMAHIEALREALTPYARQSEGEEMAKDSHNGGREHYDNLHRARRALAALDKP